jgi:hypothetical protein
MSSAQGLTPLAPVQLPPGMGLPYTEEIIDRLTGELVSVDKGQWITIAELAELFGVGRRQTTTILREMGFLQVEGSGKNSRHRIAPWVSERGWGRTNRRKTDKFPFDVISPEAVDWIAGKWVSAEEAVKRRTKHAPVEIAAAALDNFKSTRSRREMPVLQQAYWLADHFPSLTHQQMADVLSVTRQLIDRFMKDRLRQRQKWLDLKASYR